MTRHDAALIAEETVKRLREEGLVDDPVLGVKDVAKMLGVSTAFVYKHIKEIPHEKPFKKLRFFRSGIVKLIKREL